MKSVFQKWGPPILILIALSNPIKHSIAAPVSINGNISTLYNHRTFNNGDNSSSNQLNLFTIDANTDIWRPWFALVNGGLTLSENRQNSSTESSSENSAVSYNLNLNLFPTSRFPFSFYTNTNKTEDDFSAENNNETITRLTGINQSYTAIDGSSNFSGRIENSIREDIDSKTYELNVVSMNGRFKLPDNIFRTSLDYSNSLQQDNSDTTNYNALATHSYNGAENVNLENVFSASRNDVEFTNFLSDTENQQFSSFLSWRPDGRNDLNISGNFLISTTEQVFESLDPIVSANNALSDISLKNINQALFYRLNQNINISQTLGFNTVETGNNKSSSTNAASSISYTSDSLKVTLGSYNWNASTGIGLSKPEDRQEIRSITNSISHSLSNQIAIGQSSLNMSFSESLQYSSSSTGSDTGSISHNLNMNWSKNQNIQTLSIRFSASDSRPITGPENTNQLFNLQINETRQLNRNASLNSSLSLQHNRFASSFDESVTSTINGQMAYQENRFLNVDTLSYRSMVKFSYANSTDVDYIEREETEASTDTLTWQNQLSYRIGLLYGRLNLNFIKNDNNFDRSILLQLTRYFGVQ